MPLIAALSIVIDRFDITTHCLNMAKATAGLPIDLYLLDNGSVDERCFQISDKVGAFHYEKHHTNVGVAGGFNRLLFAASKAKKYDWYVLLGNDIEFLNNQWLKTLIGLHESIREQIYQSNTLKPGIISPLVDQLMGIVKQNKVIRASYGANTHRIAVNWCAYGVWVLPAELFEAIGYFDNDYNPYGCEDSDYCMRASMSGYANLQDLDMHTRHIGIAHHDDGDYRKMKDESLKKNLQIFERKKIEYKKTGDFYLPFDNQSI